MERLKYDCSWGKVRVPSLGKKASTCSWCNAKITYSVIPVPRQNPAENFGRVFLWQSGNVFLGHYLIFANICKVTISHLVSGRKKSGFINVYSSSNSMEAFLYHSSWTEEPPPVFFAVMCGKLRCAVSPAVSVVLHWSALCLCPLLVFTARGSEGFTLVAT